MGVFQQFAVADISWLLVPSMGQTPEMLEPVFNSHPLCLSLLQFYISIAAMACLSVVSAALVPPPHLPDLFPVLVSTFGFSHFFGTFLYFNVVQFSGPPSRKSQKKNN